MADRNYSITYAGAIAASTTKVFAAFTSTGATIDGDLVQVSVSFDSSTPGTGVKVELVRFTTDGTGTSYTPLRYNAAAQGRASVFTAKVNYTADPTTATIVEGYFVPNTAGQFWQLPLGREFALLPSTTTGIRVITPTGASGNVAVNAINSE